MNKFLIAVLLMFAGVSAWADACQDTVAEFRKLGDTNKFLNESYGYAVFPDIGKGGFIVGGAYGKGCVYRQGELIGGMSMGQATIGFQLGGQVYSELVVLQNKDTFNTFTAGGFEFSADATAVALTAAAQAGAGTTGSSASAGKGKGAAAWYRGMAVFTLAKGGLMYEASVGGQKFQFHENTSDKAK